MVQIYMHSIAIHTKVRKIIFQIKKKKKMKKRIKLNATTTKRIPHSHAVSQKNFVVAYIAL